MLTLQLTQSPAGDGTHRVEAALEGAGARQVAVSSFAFPLTDLDRERVRWYLEDFLEYPLDPAPGIAAGVESRLAELGERLFRGVFGSEGGRDLWATLRGRLSQTRVEIASEVSDATALPWELLRDPKTGTALALQAGSFVRVNHSPAQPARLAGSDGAALRVLLVICRPG